MSYEPTEWKSGDVISSAKLNKMEQGIANGGGVTLIANVIDDDVTTLDKTGGEILNAFKLGIVIIKHGEYQFSIAFGINVNSGSIRINELTNNGIMIYEAPNANEYPVLLNGDEPILS